MPLQSYILYIAIGQKPGLNWMLGKIRRFTAISACIDRSVFEQRQVLSPYVRDLMIVTLKQAGISSQRFDRLWGGGSL